MATVPIPQPGDVHDALALLGAAFENDRRYVATLQDIVRDVADDPHTFTERLVWLVSTSTQLSKFLVERIAHLTNAPPDRVMLMVAESLTTPPYGNDHQ